MNYSEFLEATQDGKIFTATFIKKDGNLRTMNCRRGVKKGVKGIGLSYVPSEKQIAVVFDLQKNAFRSINFNTIKELAIKGKIYKF